MAPQSSFRTCDICTVKGSLYRDPQMGPTAVIGGSNNDGLVYFELYVRDQINVGLWFG